MWTKHITLTFIKRITIPAKLLLSISHQNYQNNHQFFGIFLKTFVDNSFHPFYKQDVLILLIRKDLCGLFGNLIHIWFILAIRIISLYTVWLSSFLLIWFWAMFHWLYCFNKSWWWSSSSVTINHCSKQYRAWMTTFSTNPYFIIFQRFECSTTLSVKEVLYNKKNKFFISISKSVVTYITITVTNITWHNIAV